MIKDGYFWGSKLVRYLVEMVVIMFVFVVGVVIKNDDYDFFSIVEELIKYYIDLFNFDMDGDGLIDGVEVKLYVMSFIWIDSDSDGFIDGDEILEYKMNFLS